MGRKLFHSVILIEETLDSRREIREHKKREPQTSSFS